MRTTVTTNEAARRTGMAWGGESDAVVDLASVTSVPSARDATVGSCPDLSLPVIAITDRGVL